MLKGSGGKGEEFMGKDEKNSKKKFISLETAPIKVILKNDVRIFKRISENGIALARTGQWFERGTEVIVGQKIEMDYDHRSQLAFPFKQGTQTFYLLDEEVNRRQ